MFQWFRFHRIKTLYVLLILTALILPLFWLIKLGDAREDLQLLRNGADQIPLSTIIFPASEVIMASPDNSNLEGTVSGLQPKQVFVLKEDSIPRIVNGFKSSATELSYVRVTEAKYYLHVKTDAPFVLIFLTTFDEDWKLYFKPLQNRWEGFFLETWYLDPLDEENHFRVNGYANGWVVIPKVRESEIIMEYKPQNQYYLAFYIATSGKLLGGVVVIMYLLNSLFRRFF
jgi:hypothetical protein